MVISTRVHGYVDNVCVCCLLVFFFQAEDGIRDLVRSRGLGDVYKRQGMLSADDLMRSVAAAGKREDLRFPD